MSNLSTNQKSTVEQLLEKNEMLKAIAYVRQETNVGLKEAKDIVEQIQRERLSQPMKNTVKSPSLFARMKDAIADSYDQSMQQREQEKNYVLNNPGTQAICDFLYLLFDKDGAAYDWMKQNHKIGLGVKVDEDYIMLYYKHQGQFNHASDMWEKNEVARYTFSEIYNRMGCRGGFQSLNSTLQRKILYKLIFERLVSLKHISGGDVFAIKMFY